MTRRILLLLCLLLPASLPGAAQDVDAPAFTSRMALYDNSPALPASTRTADAPSTGIPLGGELRMAVVGGFDTLLGGGTPPAGLPKFLTGYRPILPAVDAALVFEPLIARVPDAPFTVTGVLAQDFRLSDTPTRLTFRLNPTATFSDGVGVTARDVAFSVSALKASADPAITYYWHSLTEAVATDAHAGYLAFAPGTSRHEMLTIASQLPILPRHVYTAADIARPLMSPPVGSGPYRVTQMAPDRRVIYDRNPDYWNAAARQFPIARITYDYFPTRTAARAALSAGKLDLWMEYDARQWQAGYPDLTETGFRQITRPDRQPKVVQAFVFNTRRSALANPAVRRALAAAFDAGALNNGLYEGSYALTHSFFEGTDLQAPPTPEPPEAALIAALGIPPDRLAPPESAHPGLPEMLEILYPSTALAPVAEAYASALSDLGVAATATRMDSAAYANRLARADFDIAITALAHDITPGPELREMWGSAAARVPGAPNLAGVSDPYVDRVIEGLLASADRATLRTHARLLDRLLTTGAFMVSTFHTPEHRLLVADHVRFPETAGYREPWLAALTSTAPTPEGVLTVAAVTPPKTELVSEAEKAASAQRNRILLILIGGSGVLALLWAHVRRRQNRPAPYRPRFPVYKKPKDTENPQDSNES